MDADSLPCRRCGEVTADRVIIHGRDATGALKPKTAECRGGCARDGRAGMRRGRTQRTRTRREVCGS